MITITGNLTSDGSAVGSGDPVIGDPATINVGDAFSILLSYDPASVIQSGSSFVLTNAGLTLQFDGYTFGYASAAGNYIELSSPGVFGSGTTSFLPALARQLRHGGFPHPLLPGHRYESEHAGGASSGCPEIRAPAPRSSSSCAIFPTPVKPISKGLWAARRWAAPPPPSLPRLPCWPSSLLGSADSYITISNGFVRGFGTSGVFLPANSGSGTGARIEGVTASNNNQTGILLGNDADRNPLPCQCQRFRWYWGWWNRQQQFRVV